MDLAAITAGLAAAKSGFETLRTALGLVKDAQGMLPAGERKDAVARTLEEADKQVRLAEAQIAQALGYKLCRCAFPPTPMLAVGYTPGLVREVVHECPRCRENDASPSVRGKGGPWGPWVRTAPEPVPGSAGA
jgi:hypothetical protein